MKASTQRTLIYLFFSGFFALTIALGLGGLVSFVNAEWGWAVFGVTFGFVFTELILRRPKFNWN